MNGELKKPDAPIYPPQEIAASIDLVAETDGMRVVSCTDDRELKSRISALSPRQYEILTLTAEGYDRFSVAKSLSISPGTVKRHLEDCRTALGSTPTEIATTLIPVREDDLKYVCTETKKGNSITSKLTPQGRDLWHLISQGVINREELADALHISASTVSNVRSEVMDRVGLIDRGDKQAKVYKFTRIVRGISNLNKYADELALAYAPAQEAVIRAIEDIDDEARAEKRTPQVQVIDRAKNRLEIAWLSELGYISDQDLALGQISLSAAVALKLIDNPEVSQLLAPSESSETIKTVIDHEIANYVQWLNRQRHVAA